MNDIPAPEDATVTLYDEDFRGGLMEKLSKLMVTETQSVVMKFLKNIDISVSESGIPVWPIDPQGDLLGWNWVVDWEHLKHETKVLCASVAHPAGHPYDETALAVMKKTRDGFAELVAILDAQMMLGKPSEDVVKLI